MSAVPASPDPLVLARSLVTRDLVARGLDRADLVDLVDAAARERRWWLDAWPDGAAHLAGQLAQDVQDTLLADHGLRWPACTVCDDTRPHELRVLPDLGPDPHWVCEASGIVAGPLGSLGR